MIITPILILHRYLGVVLGVLMTLWCLSGFVMMYQPFPGTSVQERAAGLEPLDLSKCCAFDKAPLADDDPAGALRVEMLNGAPVARIGAGSDALIFGLKDGAVLGELAAEGARDVAARFAAGNSLAGPVARVAPIVVDQWSVGVYRSAAPLWKATLGRDGAYIYVSGRTGEVVQDANPRERLLNWFGAIPHWLYPTMLRQNGPLWTQVVIWSAALGTFLTVTGITVGIVKLRGSSGRWFPYRRPMWFLHHVFGIFVGLFVLTWTFSGLLTMQPWGLFQSPSTFSRSDLTGDMTWKQTRALIARAKDEIAKGGVVQLRAAPLLGEPHLILRHADGRETRIGASAPLSADLLNAALKNTPVAPARAELLTREDSYYYSHHDKVSLPVLRITLADSTRVYVNASTGEIARVADRTSQRYRWLENGLHRLDFPILRSRPIWDFVVLPLLAAVTFACATGAWLSFTRIGRDVSRLRGKF